MSISTSLNVFTTQFPHHLKDTRILTHLPFTSATGLSKHNVATLSTQYFLSNFCTAPIQEKLFFSIMLKIMWEQKLYSMNNWRLGNTWFYLSEIIHEKQFMSKSHNTVCELKINAIKTIKKVRRIQFSGSPKAKKHTVYCRQFWHLGVIISMAMSSVTHNLQTQTLHLHIYFLQSALSEEDFFITVQYRNFAMTDN